MTSSILSPKSKVELSQEHFAPFLKVKEELDKKIQAEGLTAIKAFFTEFFEKRPDVYGVKWMQYTPHFNDGEPCVFRLNSVYAFATKEAFENTEDSPYDTEGAEECYKEEPQTSLEQIEDSLKVIFGDHAIVAVTRTTIEAEEYEHE